jgi:hypothetical protein
VAKLVANRDKDREFVRALIGKDIVDVDIIISRLAVTYISDEPRSDHRSRPGIRPSTMRPMTRPWRISIYASSSDGAVRVVP